MSSNAFSGSLEPLSGLVQLSDLRLDYNRFSGTVEALASLSLLTRLDLRDNLLGGSLWPTQGLVNITISFLGRNRFTDLGGLLDLVRHHALVLLDAPHLGLSLASLPAIDPGDDRFFFLNLQGNAIDCPYFVSVPNVSFLRDSCIHNWRFIIGVLCVGLLLSAISGGIYLKYLAPPSTIVAHCIWSGVWVNTQVQLGLFVLFARSIFLFLARPAVLCTPANSPSLFVPFVDQTFSPPLQSFSDFPSYLTSIAQYSLNAGIDSTPAETQAIDRFTNLCEVVIRGCRYDSATQSCQLGTLEPPYATFQLSLTVVVGYKVAKEALRALVVLWTAVRGALPKGWHSFAGRSFSSPGLLLCRPQVFREEVVLHRNSWREEVASFVLETLLGSLPELGLSVYNNQVVQQTDLDSIAVLSIFSTCLLTMYQIAIIVRLLHQRYKKDSHPLQASLLSPSNNLGLN